MKIACPNCGTRYIIDRDKLLASNGIARCRRCNNLFDAVAEEMPTEEVEPHSALQLDAASELKPAEEPSVEPRFDVPDDLEPLLPTDDAGLDIADTLYEKQSWRGLVYAVFVILLLSALGLQLAWQHRLDLLAAYPALEPLCEHLPCRPKTVHAPDRISVIQRDIRPTVNDPESLTLHARIRNDAQAAQQLPDIQLSLLDNNGAILIRRRLPPADYLYPPPSGERLIAPGEVLTITLDFKDPGHNATGFQIDFL